MTDETHQTDDEKSAPEAGAAEESGQDARAELEAARAEIAELNDRILRLAAELENTRRRAEREKQDASRYAIANFARDMLNVADTFERALAAAPADDGSASGETIAAFVSGLKLADKDLMAALERHGVKRINPVGEKFDPHLHQAVAQAPGPAPAGFVLEVAQPGFVIGERVLRAAMVIVSSGPVDNPKEDESGSNGVHFDTRV
ncbi:MAG: nucleotide exchange factor GrpE [Alphaproteobacteria bacterium]|nr:nucleotide exchange factor GrpE [Alphaproteobacteria bacterium]